MNRVRILGIRILKSLVQPEQLPRVRIIGVKKFETIEAEVIRTRRGNPYWKEQGWEKKGDEYDGYYKTDYGRWAGFTVENFKGDYSFYIFDPPKAVIKGPHKECFTHQGKRIFSIHFSNKPEDIDSGILAVEKIIMECF
jgi:hypothetical protein